VDFLKALCPSGIVADPLIGERMKVSVPAILATSEDNTGNFSIRAFIKKSMGRREPQTAEAQFSSQTHAARKITNTLLGTQHAPYNKRRFGEMT